MAAHEVVKFDVSVHVAQFVHLFDAKKHLEAHSYSCLHAELLSFALIHKSMDIGTQELSHDVERIVWLVKSAI